MVPILKCAPNATEPKTTEGAQTTSEPCRRLRAPDREKHRPKVPSKSIVQKTRPKDPSKGTVQRYRPKVSSKSIVQLWDAMNHGSLGLEVFAFTGGNRKPSRSIHSMLLCAVLHGERGFGYGRCFLPRSLPRNLPPREHRERAEGAFVRREEKILHRAPEVSPEPGL